MAMDTSRMFSGGVQVTSTATGTSAFCGPDPFDHESMLSDARAKPERVYQVQGAYTPTEIAAPIAQSKPESSIAVLDLRPIEDHQQDITPHREEEPEQRVRPVGPGWGALMTALGWTGAAVGLPIATFGVDGLLAQSPLLIGGLAALAVLPPTVMLAASAVTRETQRARLEQQRMIRNTRKLLLSDEVGDRAMGIGRSIRAEIDGISQALNAALNRMSDLEAAAARNAQAFSTAVSDARTGASALSEALNGERAAFAQLNADLHHQTEHLGASVARQIRMMREASMLVRQETASADQRLTSSIEALAVGAHAIGERTRELHDVVDAAATGARRFDQTLGKTLEVMGETTKLNDAARQAAESSAIAAQQAAQAVRDASVRATADARRATELIRAEAKVMQDQAQTALDQLRAAAEEARQAADTADAAASRFSTTKQKIVSEPAPPQQTYARAPSRTMSFGGASAAIAEPANDYDPMDDLRRRALSIVTDSGVSLDDAFTTADLDYIAGRSKEGAPARRRAVSLAAMDSVQRISHRLASDPRAKGDAMSFRAHPELATGESGRGALKAYLLLDAALG